MKFIQCRICFELVPSNESHCSCGNLRLKQRSDAPDAPAVHSFASGFYEHIADDPIYIKNRKQLLHETRRRGQVSLYAED